MEAMLHNPNGSMVLGSGTVSIGSTSDNQLILSDGSAGAHHAEIRSEGQGHSIIDLGTSVGTFVNGQRIYPQVPQVLQNGDTVSIGSSQLTYEVRSSSGVAPTVYASPGSSSVPPTTYGSYDAASNASYPPPSSAAPPPPVSNYSIDPYGSAPPKKKSRRGLWITLGVIGGLLVVVVIAFIAIAGRGPSTTPTQTYQAYCAALKAKDAHTAHGFFASTVQQQVTEDTLKNEAAITTNCAASKVDDTAGSGVITYTLTSGGSLIEDDKVVQENNNWKIDYQKVRSSPALTLIEYCRALAAGDFHTAYTKFSGAVQSQTSESQFTSSFNGSKPTDCVVSNVDDKASAGLVTMTFASGPASFDEKLVNESGTWKINSEQQHSTPTVTLNNYCSALKQGDYQTAYNQFSSDYQKQQSEAQFAASFPDGKPSDCTISNVDDNTGKGMVTMTIKGTALPLDETLISENGVWKIKTEQQHK